MSLRIAYLINHYPAVSHSFIRREILALEKRGFEILRIALRGWDGVLADPADEVERERTWFVLQAGVASLLKALIAEACLRPSKFFSALRLAVSLRVRSEKSLGYHLVYLAEACAVARWLRRAGVRHLHAHFGTNSAEVAMLTSALGDVAYSLTIHGSEEFDRPEAIALPQKLRGAAFVAAVSSFTRSQLFRWVEGVHWEKIHVVHCGLDSTFLGSEVPSTSTTRRLVSVGRLREQKGHLLLLTAMRMAFDRGCMFDLVLVGDGELRSDVDQLIRALALEDHVRITGWVGEQQVREEMLAARALIHPSFAEGLPVVIMESMALGRPVIATYVGGIPELVRPGENGWLIPAGDVPALTDAIVECLDAPTESLERMGALGRKRVLARHEVDIESGKLAALFQRQAGICASGAVRSSK